MASRIKAISAYRPKIKLGQTVQTEELIAYVSGRTGLNEGELSLAMKEVRDAIAFFNLSGRPVKLEGLGIYTPKIGLNGVFGVAHRLSQELKNRLNTPGAFRGVIENLDMIGKTVADLIARWNTEHPDDPVVD